MNKLLFALLLISHAGWSQPPETAWSEKFPDQGNIVFNGVIGEHLFVTQELNQRKFISRRYNAALELIGEEVQELEKPSKNGTYLTSFTTDSALAHLRSIPSGNKGKLNIWLYTSSLCSNPQPEPLLIAEIDAGYNGWLMHYYSADRSKLMICNFSFRPRTNTAGRDFVVISTHSGKTMYTGKASYQNTAETIAVDNAGNAYFIAPQYYREGNKLTGKQKSFRTLYIFLPDGSKKEHLVSFEGKYTPAIDLVATQQNEWYAAGFRFDEEAAASRPGKGELFMYHINLATGAITDSFFIEVNGLYPDRRLKTEERLPYSIRAISQTAGGGYTVVAEQYQVVTGQYSAQYQYNDISIIQWKPGDLIASVSIIAKRQTSIHNVSVATLLINERTYIFYDDLQENERAEPEQVKMPSNNSAKNGLFVVKADISQPVKKELLYGYDTGKPIPVILNSYPLKNQSLFLSSKAQIGLLRFTK